MRNRLNFGIVQSHSWSVLSQEVDFIAGPVGLLSLGPKSECWCCALVRVSLSIEGLLRKAGNVVIAWTSLIDIHGNDLAC